MALFVCFLPCLQSHHLNTHTQTPSFPRGQNVKDRPPKKPTLRFSRLGSVYFNGLSIFGLPGDVAASSRRREMTPPIGVEMVLVSFGFFSFFWFVLGLFVFVCFCHLFFVYWFCWLVGLLVLVVCWFLWL